MTDRDPASDTRSGVAHDDPGQHPVDAAPSTSPSPSPDPAPAASASPARRSPDGSWWRSSRVQSLVGLLVCLAVVWVLVGLHVRAYREVSPYDEIQHIDSLFRALDLEWVATGDQLGDDTMREVACRGLDADFRLPACEDDHEPEQFPEGGYNTASIHPPTYYAASGWFGRLVEWATPAESPVTGGRLAGALWLGGAVVALWYCFALFGVRVLTRMGWVALAVTSPVVLFQSATVNPDATAPLAGAALLAAVLAWERHRVPALVPAVVAGLAIALKSTNIVAVLVALGYLGVRWLQQRAELSEAPRRSTRDLLVAGVSLIGATAAVSLAVVFQQGRIARIPADELPMVARMQVDEFPWDRLMGSLGTSPLAVGYYPPVWSEGLLLVLAAVVVAALPVATLVALALEPAGSRLKAIAATGIAGALATGPLFVLANYVLTGIYTAIPSRYGLAAAPAMMVAAAAVTDRGPVRYAVAGLGAVLVVTTAWSLA